MVGTQRRSQRVASLAAAAAAAKEEKNAKKEDNKKAKEDKKEKETVVKKASSTSKAKASAKAPVKAKVESSSKKNMASEKATEDANKATEDTTKATEDAAKTTEDAAKTTKKDDNEVVPTTAREQELPTPAAVEGPSEAAESSTTATNTAASSDQVVVSIEACKQWGAFKTRANKIAHAIGNKARVQINKEKVSIIVLCEKLGMIGVVVGVLYRVADVGGCDCSRLQYSASLSPPFQPGRGNFVVRVSGVDHPIVELLGMKRPFPLLKALDIEEVKQKILKALE
jgi:hypothetical protein